MADYRAHGIDGALLAKVRDGNHLAIRQFAKMAAAHVRDMAEQCRLLIDDATPVLAEILDRIADGERPDDAFNWRPAGRPRGNETWLLWSLAMHVNQLRAAGMSREAAVALVGDAARMDGKRGGKLDRAYDQFKNEAIPDDLYPIPDAHRAELPNIERRIADALTRQ